MRKKITNLILLIALFVFVPVFALCGCENGNTNNSSIQNEENQEKTLTYMDIQLDNGTKYSYQGGASIVVEHGTTLTAEDIDISSAIAHYSDGTQENVDTSLITIDGLPDVFDYSIGNYIFNVHYGEQSSQVFVTVQKKIVSIQGVNTALSFSMDEILNSNLTDNQGKYINIVSEIDSLQDNGAITLQSLIDAGYILPANNDFNSYKLRHGTGFDGFGDPYNNSVSFHIDWDCPYTFGESNDLVVSYNVTPKRINAPRVDTNHTEFVFDPTREQGPALIFDGEDYSEYFEHSTQYNSGEFNYYEFHVIGEYSNDFMFWDNDRMVWSEERQQNICVPGLASGKTMELNWRIVPKTLSLPTLDHYEFVYNGLAPQPQVLGIPEELQPFYQSIDYSESTNVGRTNLYVIFDNNGIELPNGQYSYINDYRWDMGINAETGEHIYESVSNSLTLYYEIVKADYTLPEDIRNARIRMTTYYDNSEYSVDYFLGQLNMSNTIANIINDEDYETLNELQLFDSYYTFSATEYLNAIVLRTIGTHSIEIAFTPDTNHNPCIMQVSLTVVKQDMYVGAFGWNDNSYSYVYDGEPFAHPTIYNHNDDIFTATYTTYHAIYNNNTSAWEPTDDAITTDIIDAGNYITCVEFNSNVYNPVINDQDSTTCTWSITKAWAWAPTIDTNDDYSNYNDLLLGNYYGSHDKSTNWGCTTIKHPFTYYSGVAKQIYINSYYTTGDGHYDYYTGITLTHEYSADGASNWTNVTSDELINVGYYRSTLTFTCDSNHMFDSNGNGTQSSSLIWRILPNVIHVDSITFGDNNTTPTSYVASETEGHLPVLPDGIVPEYLDVEYTYYYWNTDYSEWYVLNYGRAGGCGNYKVIATLRAIPDYDGADGVIYKRNNTTLTHESEPGVLVADTEFTVELEYEVTIISANDWELPDELATGDLILAYNYAVNDDLDTWEKFVRNIHWSSILLGEIDFDNTTIVSNNKTSSQIIYNYDVSDDERIWQYNGLITIVDAYRDDPTKKQALIDAIANHTTTDIENDDYWTIILSYTRNAGVYEPKEFEVKFYIAPMVWDVPEYLISTTDSTYTTLELVYEYTANQPALTISDLENLFGYYPYLTSTTNSLHFDNTKIIYDGKTSLEIANDLNARYGHYARSVLTNYNKADLLDKFNAKQPDTIETIISITPDDRVYENREFHINITIIEKPSE